MGKDATERRGETLDPEHPLRLNPEVAPESGDCISDVPAELLDEVAAFHDREDPPDTSVNPEELV